MPTLRGMARGLGSTHHPRALPTLMGKQREVQNPPLKERRHTTTYTVPGKHLQRALTHGASRHRPPVPTLSNWPQNL